MTKISVLTALALAATGGVVLVTTTSSSAAEDATTETSLVEDYTHPGAETILAQHGLKLFKGDGHIVFDSVRTYDETECATGMLQIEKSTPNTAPYGTYYCFKTIGTTGFLTLEVPGTIGVRAGDEALTAKAKLPDGTALPTYSVEPNKRVAIEPGDDDEEPQAILVEVRLA